MKLHAPTFLLIVAAVFCAALQYLSLPPQPAPEKRTEDQRRALANTYLGYKNIEKFDMAGFLDPSEKRMTDIKFGPDQLEALAVLFGLEGRTKTVAKILEQKPTNADLVAYAFLEGEHLAADWETRVPPDLFGAYLAYQISLRLGDQGDIARASFKVRQLEQTVMRTVKAQEYTNLLGLLGLGLMVSMIISNRHFKRMGRAFFPLTPLFIPMATLFRFFAAFLSAYVLIDFMLASLLAAQMPWLRDVLGTCLQIAVGFVLLRKILFPSPRQNLFRALGVDNLTMRFGNLFQILGGIGMLLACNMIALVITSSIWPYDRMDLNHYTGLAENPLAGGLFMLIGCVLAGAFLELLFRGLLFRSLLSLMKPWQALLLSALLFALIHPLAAWPIRFAIGIGLGLMYYRTANLVVNIWAHATWNCLFLVLALMGVSL